MVDVDLKPLFARVLLQREKMKNSTLIIPDDAAKRNAPAKGKVVAVGPAADSVIEVGKTYLFGRHAGTWLNSEGTVVVREDDAEFYLVQDEDMLCEVAQ